MQRERKEAHRYWERYFMQPTEEQLKSRKEVEDFLTRVARPVKEWLKGIKSEWFGRPDKELQDWVERGRWWDEVKDTRWYQNQLATIDYEIKWSQEQFEVGKEDPVALRSYIRALRFVKGHILTTERNAEIASRVLAHRAGEIEKHTFVSGGMNDRSRNN